MLDAYSLCWEMKIGDVKSRTKEAEMPVKLAFLQSCGRVSCVLILTILLLEVNQSPGLSNA